MGVTAFWDRPLYADTTHVTANRIDAEIVDNESKTVSVIEMSCPWVENSEAKTVEKISMYGPHLWELQQRYPSHRVTQYNIIIDVLGGFFLDVSRALKQLLVYNSKSIAS